MYESSLSGTTMTRSTPFKGDWVSPTCDTILDALEELGMNQAEFASRMGFSKKHVNGLIQGKVAITAETALKLEKVLGAPTRFWLQREGEYREDLARRKAEKEALTQKEWLKEFPLTQMAKWGWFRRIPRNPALQVMELLSFFGVANVEAWSHWMDKMAPTFRASPAMIKRRAPMSAWLRQAEKEAQKLSLPPFDEKALRTAIPTLRALYPSPGPGPRPRKLIVDFQEICGKCGVGVVLVPAPRGCSASGATWWATPKRAVLALSLRYKTGDQLRFSFFHELGHILLHGKRLRFLEVDDKDSTKMEEEANRFASKTLIPNELGFKKLIASKPNKRTILRFAEEMSIHPGIVVGRLQHEKIVSFRVFNHLKERYGQRTDEE